MLYFRKTKCCWPREVVSSDVLCLLLLAVSTLAQRRQALTRHFRIIQTHLFFFCPSSYFNPFISLIYQIFFFLSNIH